MAARAQDDFFGVSMLSANPYASRYQPVHDMKMQAKQAQGATQENVPAMMPAGWANMFGGTARGMTAPPAGPGASQRGVTKNAWQQNPNGTYTDPDTGVTTLPGDSETGPGDIGGTTGRTNTGGNIPQDLPALRNTLQSYMMDRLQAGGRWDPMFSQEELTYNADPSWGRMNNQMYNTLGAANDMTHQGFDQIRRLMGMPMSNGADLSQLNPYLGMSQGAGGALQGLINSGGGNTLNPAIMQMILGGQGMSALNYGANNPSAISDPLLQGASNGAGMQGLQGMIANGGSSNIQSQLDSIMKSGKMGIEDTLAQIREQYGAMGLGAGSDIADALGRGASRGYADIIKQQSELATGMNESAQGRRLAAMGAESGNFANLLNSVGQLNLGTRGQGIQAGQGIQSSLADLLQQYSSNMTGSYGRQIDAANSLFGNSNSAMGTFGGLLQGNEQLRLQDVGMRYGGANNMIGAGGQMTNNLASLLPGMMGYASNQDQMSLGNMQRWQQERLRQAGGPPILDKALGYATNVPNPNPPYNQSSGWPSALGSIAGGIISTIPFWSDRNMKEDVRPVNLSVLDKLKMLDIPTWRYKGDPIRHIGPMAQDFAAAFGVGDGKRIFPQDVMGVMLASMKELAHANS